MNNFSASLVKSHSIIKVTPSWCGHCANCGDLEYKDYINWNGYCAKCRPIRAKNSNERVYITRYGAVGDCIHASYLPRLLKEKLGYGYVAVEYNLKGWTVFQNNPYIDEHIHLEPPPGYPISFFQKRWIQIMEQKKFTKHINLQDSLERGYIAMEYMPEYYMSSEFRRNKFGGMNYYDQIAVWAGFPEFKGNKGELYFTDEEEKHIKKQYETEFKDKFVVVCNLSGTGPHKLFYNSEGIIKRFLDKHKDAVCVTMGDGDCKKLFEFTGERIINRAGVYPFRQSMLVVKHADLVIGCESGLMVAATALGAPTVQLMTAASVKNHGGDFLNDYSLQSPCYCSPCHKGPYEYIGCPKFEYLGRQMPLCIKFDPETILERMDEVYDNRK